ncbi:MAG TPA: hypothetical protein VEP69_02010, partial [Thermodesulfovibrionales bacterium]|nr:hypothetical protein [Thermodesulfovibrionales bacterium]
DRSLLFHDTHFTLNCMAKHQTPESRLRTALGNRGVSTATVRIFRKIIRDNYRENCREMPWRRSGDPYRVLVSEIMLQQTQVERVLQKYGEFISAFPDIGSLARAPLSRVLRVWQGMGYNRRALSLKRLAETVVREYDGRLPDVPEELVRLPGIGPYSAAAIYTFVHDRPSLLIETNIRRVYIHFFFNDREAVRDAEIMPLIERTLDRKAPREWYYALMDYGVKLKKEVKNPNRRSIHYQKPSAFHGSTRQARGMVLRELLKTPGMTKAALRKKIHAAPERIDRTLEALLKDHLIIRTGRRYSIP